MRTTRLGFSAIDLIPEALRAFLARRAAEVIGLVLVVTAIGAALALATWSVRDPSINHATEMHARNALGFPGAITADLLMQLFGLGSIVALAIVAVWGWKLLAGQPLPRGRARVMAGFFGALAACALFSGLPATERWPLPTGLGGVVGDALVRAPAILFGAASVLQRIAFGAIFLLIMTATFIWASGKGSRPAEPSLEIDDDDAPFDDGDDHASVSLGWAVHALMSAKARFKRLRLGALVAAAYKSLVSSAPQKSAALAYERQEPNLSGGSAPSLVPARGDIDDEEDEDEEDDDAPAVRAPRRKTASRAPAKKSGKFDLPSVNVLSAPRAADRQPLSKAELETNSRALEGVLGDFGVRGEIVKANPGPVVTLYELEPAPGIKSSRVIGLADDIARSMSALSARVAVVAGRNAIGIELPNAHREKVYLRELLTAKDAADSVAKLPLCLGKTIGGDPVIIDLARTPHMLIAGTTGSGKSVAINTMILSLVYRLRPDQCRLIMVDPKMLELSVYDGIPHLLTPVVTDPKKAVVALKWAVREMEERYKKMSKLGVRNIDGYNQRLVEAKGKGEELTRTVHTGFDKESGKAIYEDEKLDLEPLPYIVIIVDEMADLMMVAGKDIEGAVQRLAQMARAAGLHVILATQRPSVDVITGTIKANFPTRISFQVTSKIDSRTILGEMGAEQLLGQGDMLYMAGGGRISRVHGPFVSDEEVEKVVRHLKTQGQPEYLEAVTAEEPTDEDGAVFDGTSMGSDGGGDLFSQAVAIVKRDRKASTSYIQRRLQIGYNRAASLMERMELEGIVGQANHAGKREILIEEEEGHF
jgi:S-DNA-T family DNA segregation ATPase FtsK/SpoIIIE